MRAAQRPNGTFKRKGQAVRTADFGGRRVATRRIRLIAEGAGGGGIPRSQFISGTGIGSVPDLIGSERGLNLPDGRNAFGIAAAAALIEHAQQHDRSEQENEPGRDQEFNQGKAFFHICWASVYIGRMMAATKPPTATPSTTMMSGSIAVERLATEALTSRV